jgi:hypothetical protein
MRRGRGVTEAGRGRGSGSQEDGTGTCGERRKGWKGKEEWVVTGLTGAGAGGRQARVGSRWVQRHDDGDGQAREMRGSQ